MSQTGNSEGAESSFGLNVLHPHTIWHGGNPDKPNKPHKDIYNGGEIKPSEPRTPKTEIEAYLIHIDALQDSNKDLIELNRQLVSKELKRDTLVMKVLGIGVLIGAVLGFIIESVFKLL